MLLLLTRKRLCFSQKVSRTRLYKGFRDISSPYANGTFSINTHRPGRIFSTSGGKNKGLKLNGDCHSRDFLAGDLNSIVFKSENSVGMEKITRYFALRIYLFHYFPRGQDLEYIFPLGTIFRPIFPVGRGPSGSVRRGCYGCCYTKKVRLVQPKVSTL